MTFGLILKWPFENSNQMFHILKWSFGYGNWIGVWIENYEMVIWKWWNDHFEVEALNGHHPNNHLDHFEKKWPKWHRDGNPNRIFQGAMTRLVDHNRYWKWGEWESFLYYVV